MTPVYPGTMVFIDNYNILNPMQLVAIRASLFMQTTVLNLCSCSDDNSDLLSFFPQCMAF